MQISVRRSLKEKEKGQAVPPRKKRQDKTQMPKRMVVRRLMRMTIDDKLSGPSGSKLINGHGSNGMNFARCEDNWIFYIYLNVFVSDFC